MMQWDKPLIRLPMIHSDVCPICSQTLSVRRQFPVFLSDSQTGRKLVREYGLLYCVKCGIPFADQVILDRLSKNAGIKPDSFEAGKDKYQILSKMYSGKRKRSSRPNGKNISSLDEKRKSGGNEDKYLGFPVIEDGYADPYKPHKFVCNGEIKERCPDCMNNLLRMTVCVPFAAKRKVVIDGYGCKNCDTLFIHQDLRYRVKRLLDEHNIARAGFTLLHDSPYDYLEVLRKKKNQEKLERRKKEKEESLQPLFERYPSAYVILIVLEGLKKRERTIIIVNDAEDENPENGVYRYSSPEGLEYLSAAFADNRQGRGSLKKTNFVVSERVYEYKGRGKQIIDDWIMNLYLYIRPDGGNMSSTIGDPMKKLVDMLIFCSKTNRYEIVKTTWDLRRNIYYTDMRHFWDFVYRYGRPEVELVFYDKKKNDYRRSWKDLNDESILMQFGYNAREGGPDQFERRKILGDLIDLEVLTQNEAIRYLEFFISGHPNAPDAIEKWMADIEFVMNYEYDPYRFILNR